MISLSRMLPKKKSVESTINQMKNHFSSSNYCWSVTAWTHDDQLPQGPSSCNQRSERRDLQFMTRDSKNLYSYVQHLQQAVCRQRVNPFVKRNKQYTGLKAWGQWVCKDKSWVIKTLKVKQMLMGKINFTWHLTSMRHAIFCKDTIDTDEQYTVIIKAWIKWIIHQ